MDATSGLGSGQVQSAENGPQRASARSILIQERKAGAIELRDGERANLGGRVARFGELVSRSREMGRFVATVDQSRSEKLAECGTWLLFREYFDHPDKPVKLAGGCFCQQHMLCDFCASRRSARFCQTLNSKLVEVLRSNPNQTPYGVTLTIRTRDDLAEARDVLLGGFSKLMQRRRDALKGRNDSVMGLMGGGFVNAECKLSKGEWHYHLHGIWVSDAIDRYVPIWERLKREWAKIVNQDHANVYFKPLSRDPVEGWLPSVREMCKYTVKADNEMTHAERWSAFKTLFGVRALRTFGSFRNVKLPELLTDDLAALDAYQFRELWYRYLDDLGVYLRRDVAEQEGLVSEYAGDFDAWNAGQ